MKYSNHKRHLSNIKLFKIIKTKTISPNSTYHPLFKNKTLSQQRTTQRLDVFVYYKTMHTQAGEESDLKTTNSTRVKTGHKNQMICVTKVLLNSQQ